MRMPAARPCAANDVSSAWSPFHTRTRRTSVRPGSWTSSHSPVPGPSAPSCHAVVASPSMACSARWPSTTLEAVAPLGATPAATGGPSVRRTCEVTRASSTPAVTRPASRTRLSSTGEVSSPRPRGAGAVPGSGGSADQSSGSASPPGTSSRRGVPQCAQSGRLAALDAPHTSHSTRRAGGSSPSWTPVDSEASIGRPPTGVPHSVQNRAASPRSAPQWSQVSAVIVSREPTQRGVPPDRRRGDRPVAP